MNKLRSVGIWIVALGLIGLISLNAAAQDVGHGRISYAAESGLIKGVDDDDWAYAALNSIVMPGDTIWADEEGVLEVELMGGTFIRLADGSRVDIVSTPPETVLRGWTGSFYIQRVSSRIGDVVFETPVARVHIEPDSQVRIDVLDEGPTTVSVRWGAAVIHTDIGEAVRVRAGERSYVDPGYLPSTPVEFDRGVEDAFDSWNRDRARQKAYGMQNVPIASAGYDDAPIGVSDLSGYGEWVYVDDKTYWRPTVVQDYVPYRDGSWSYVPAQGHVWVGHHPFSYITSHHGYWSHHPHHGWLWSYHHAYSPAYVFSVRYGDQFIWAPIDPYGYPVYYASDYFTIGGIHFSFGFSTFAYSYDLLYGHHSYHAFQHHNFHHHNDYHYWNIHAHDSRYDTHVRPHWPRDRVRNYSPERVLRGPSQNRDRTQLARDRATRLETRTARDRFKVASARPTRGVRTTNNSVGRQSTLRDVRIRPDALTRSARSNDAVRSSASGPRRSVRPLTNRDARNTRPLSRGQVGSRDTTATPSGTGRTRIQRETRGQSDSGTIIQRGLRDVDSRPNVSRPSRDRSRPLTVGRTRTQVSRPTTSGPTTRSSVVNRRGGRVSAPPTQRATRQPAVTRSPVSRPTVTAPRNQRQTVTSRPNVGNRASTNSNVSRRSAAAPPAVSRPSVSAPRAQPTYRSQPRSAPSRSSSPSVSSRSSSPSRVQAAPRSSSGGSRASQSRGGSPGRSSSAGGRVGRR